MLVVFVLLALVVSGMLGEREHSPGQSGPAVAT
jgi:hypothetical protein